MFLTKNLTKNMVAKPCLKGKTPHRGGGIISHVLVPYFIQATQII